MLVSLLFPFLLFVVVVLLFGIEQRLLPPDRQAPAAGLSPDDAHAGVAPDSAVPAAPIRASAGAVPHALYEEDGRRSLHHHLSLWERIDPAIEEDYRDHSLRSVIDPKTSRPRQPRDRSRREAGRRQSTRRRRSAPSKRRAA